MVELLQSLLTLTKEFGPGAVSTVGCLVLVWYMWSHIKDIGKQHNERFDKLHEMHRDERDKWNATTSTILQNNTNAITKLTTFIEAKL